jgi:TPR repeat protein
MSLSELLRRSIPSWLARSTCSASRFAALAIGLALAPVAVLADGRVALIIGNSEYRDVPALDNPNNDAADMAQSLESLGFEVLLGTDLARNEMIRLVDRFSAAAADSEVALFYFAGHAFQVGGRNYLVPVDLVPSAQDVVLAQSLSLDVVMEALDKAPGLRLVFLDACRDNPLGISEASGEGGLARVGSGADFLIAYATQPGAVAFDGDGRNGTYTEALLNHIQTPGLNVGEMMIAVRKDVIAATGGQQIPWENSSLTRQFEFDSGPRSVSEETMLFQIAARTGHPGLMQLYIDRYPQGAHVAEALLLRTQDAGAQGRGVQPGSAEDVDNSEELWRLAQRTRLRQLAEFYVDSYPQGEHVAEARELISTIPEITRLGPGRLCERLATHPRDATAATAGVDFEQLRPNAVLAIDTCSAAVLAFPEQPRYVALLARALIAAGRRDEAITHYQEAAARGDLRAMVSLGLLTESGDGVPKDPLAAIQLYERAADGGSLDGAVNFAVALYQGQIVPQDIPRAVELLRRASDQGSAIASFNLGVLAQEGSVGDAAEALDLFRKATRFGEPRAYRAAAVLLDAGRGTEKDPTAAAEMLLRGAAEDRGEVLTGMTSGSDSWSRDAVGSMQSRLQKVGLYPGQVDGVIGPQFIDALQAWRSGGFDEAAFDD